MFDSTLSCRVVAALAGLYLVAGCDTGGSDRTGAAPAGDADATSAELAQDTTGSGQGPDAQQRSVVSEVLPYADVDDELVYGHFAFPSDMIEPLPAVIMIHEWWGLNDTVRAMADRLAAEGYIVLAVDLFAGATATSLTEARQLMVSAVESSELATENIRQAYNFVDETAGAPRIATLGWGFGGGWSLNAAMLFPDELDAAVIYYGQVTDDEDKLRPISAPVLGLFGAEDRGVKVDAVRAFEQALERLRKDYRIHVYPGGRHAFANPTGSNHDADLAEDAWNKTLEFLDQNLSPADAS